MTLFLYSVSEYQFLNTELCV